MLKVWVWVWVDGWVVGGGRWSCLTLENSDVCMISFLHFSRE